MSIYDILGSAPAATLAEKQWATNMALSQLIQQHFQTLSAIYKVGFDFVNNNPGGLSQTEVVVGIGASDWTKFYIEAVMLKTLVNHVVPGTISDPVGASTIVLTIDNSSPAGGSTVTLTATITAANPSATATGFVTFYDGMTPIGQSLLTSGVASVSCTIATGAHQFTAMYSGDLGLCPESGSLSVTAS